MMTTQRPLVEKYEIESCSFQIKHFPCLQPFIKPGLRIRIRIKKSPDPDSLFPNDRSRTLFDTQIEKSFTIDTFFYFNGSFIWFDSDPDPDLVFLENRIRIRVTYCRVIWIR